MGKKKDGAYFHTSQNSAQPDYIPTDTELTNNNSILTHKIFQAWKVQSIDPNASSLFKKISVYTLPNNRTESLKSIE